MSGPARIRAVMLGSLGILTDLRDQERHAFNRAFAEHGLATTWSARDYDAILARHGRYLGIEAELDGLALADRPAFLGRVEEAFRDILDASQPILRPWTEDLLTQARARNLRLAPVSGAERATSLRVLAALFGTRASLIFDVTTCLRMAPAPKPAPDLYAAALARLSLAADRALAFETTADGIAAARAAGLRTFAVETAPGRGEDLSAADHPQPPSLKAALAAAALRILRAASPPPIHPTDPSEERLR
jgi:HAD superfamily hydrolase (TIGR01509 family)